MSNPLITSYNLNPMRKLFISLVVVTYITIPLLAQMVVSDPTMAGLTVANKAALIKQLEEASRQTAQLKQSYDQLTKATEVYYKVSNTLRNVEQLQTLLNDQTSLIIRCGDAVKSIGKVKATPRSINDYKNNIDYIVRANQANLKLIKDVLEEGFFKMNDAERLKLIMDIKDRTAKAMKDVNSYQAAFEQSSSMINFVKQNL